MIYVTPPPEPPTFDAACRQKGNHWLHGIPEGEASSRLALLQNPEAKRRVKRPPAHWTGFEQELYDAFHGRCAYSSMYEAYGAIDHFIPQDTDPTLMFEWSNYRYANDWLNKTRKTTPFPDPFIIQDVWFELGYPTLMLTFTSAAPSEYATRYAGFLELLNHPKVIRTRETWRDLYLQGKLSREGLDACAPLLARAIRRYEAEHPPSP